MSLAPGTRFGAYEVVEMLGAGGMGQVYRARDTRLDRMVAVKMLAPALASEDFRVRFADEAKAISALNHPHICGLYDIGRDHDTAYLVLELLEGETLAARIERGALLTAQVLRYGIEISDALEPAHRHGIIHRDLKPANIKITLHGTVKVLDFWLARALGPVGVSAGVSQSPNHHVAGNDAHGCDPGYRGVHEPRTGTRAGRRQVHRRLCVLRMRAL